MSATDAQETKTTSTRLYVGNLSWSADWSTLKDFFRTRVGNVAHVEVLQFPDGRSKGCAIVEFEDSATSARAMAELNDIEFQGRKIFLREDREERGFGQTRAPVSAFRGRPAPRAGAAAPVPRTPATPGTQIYVGNLPWRTAWQDLKDLFSQYGEVVRADVATDRFTNRSKGFGTVRFANAEDAQSAIDALNDTEFQGRKIVVRVDEKI